MSVLKKIKLNMFSNKHTTLYYLLKVTYKIIYKNKKK